MKHFLLSCTLLATMGAHAQTITEYRWWLNDDVGTLTTASVAPDADLTLNADLDLPVLSMDYNTITIQFKDSDGRYGVPYTMPFSRGTGAVTGYEWWIDDDVPNRTVGTIGPADVVDLIADLPTGVTSGDHTFTIRFSSVNGTWSVPLSTTFTFIVGLEELPGISDLLLFPNPTNDELSLRLNSADGDQLRLSILDATGRTVRAEENWAPHGVGIRTWDLTELTPGSYALRIVRGEQQATMRFQKN